MRDQRIRRQRDRGDRAKLGDWLAVARDDHGLTIGDTIDDVSAVVPKLTDGDAAHGWIVSHVRHGTYSARDRAAAAALHPCACPGGLVRTSARGRPARGVRYRARHHLHGRGDVRCAATRHDRRDAGGARRVGRRHGRLDRRLGPPRGDDPSRLRGPRRRPGEQRGAAAGGVRRGRMDRGDAPTGRRGPRPIRRVHLDAVPVPRGPRAGRRRARGRDRSAPGRGR